MGHLNITFPNEASTRADHIFYLNREGLRRSSQLKAEFLRSTHVIQSLEGATSGLRAASTAADAGDLVSSKNWPLKVVIAAGRHVFHDM